MADLSKVMAIIGAVVVATLAGAAPPAEMSDGIQRYDTSPDAYHLLLSSSPAFNDTLIQALGVHVALGDSVYGVTSVDAHGRLDAALLRLDRPVTHVEPVRRSTTHPFLLMGRKAVFVGFGARGTGFDLELAAPGIKGAGSNRIDMVSLEPDGAHRLWWDFDHPEDATLNKLGSSEPLPTEYMSIGGDSGGGVFVADSPGYVVVALVGSGGSYPFPHQQPRVHGYYGSFGYEVSITSVNRWLDSLVAGR